MRRYDLLRQRQLRLVKRRLVTVTLVGVRVPLVVLHHLENVVRRAVYIPRRAQQSIRVVLRRRTGDGGRDTHKVHASVGDDLLGRVHRRAHRFREEVNDGGRLRLVPQYQHARRHQGVREQGAWWAINSGLSRLDPPDDKSLKSPGHCRQAHGRRYRPLASAVHRDAGSPVHVRRIIAQRHRTDRD